MGSSVFSLVFLLFLRSSDACLSVGQANSSSSIQRKSSSSSSESLADQCALCTASKPTFLTAFPNVPVITPPPPVPQPGVGLLTVLDQNCTMMTIQCSPPASLLGLAYFSVSVNSNLGTTSNGPTACETLTLNVPPDFTMALPLAQAASCSFTTTCDANGVWTFNIFGSNQLFPVTDFLCTAF